MLNIVFLVLSHALTAEEIVQFEKKKISVGGKEVVVELAITPEQLSRGLMRRNRLDKNSGMLFRFSKAKILTFWMKETVIPLSIAFFDENGILTEIQDMDLVGSVMEVNPRLYSSKNPSKYALEMNRGWFKKNSILPGAKLDVDLKEK